MRLAGKKALVTGASRGIGRAIAEAFVESGIQVVGTSRNPSDCDWPDGVEPLELDVSSPESVERCWREARLGERGFSIIVNNAGSGVFGAFDKGEFPDWERQVGLMLLGPMKLSHLALCGWSRETPGVLVNVGSLAVEYPIPYMSGYNAAKAGLAAFSESLLLELDPEAARVIELRIGDVDTDFNDYAKRVGDLRGEREERVWKAMCRHIKSGPTPAHVARTLVEAIMQERRGVVRAGTFFQTTVASLFGRIVSQRVKRAVNLSYYKAGKD